MSQTSKVSAAQHPAIEVENATYSYEGAEGQAVSGVTLHVEKGAFVAVLGRNGSGKSTFAKLLNALFTPQSGRVVVLGMDTSDEKLTFAIRQNAGMVFQNPDNQLVATLVEEDVAFGPENLGVPPQEIRARVDDALEAVGMTAFAKSAPHRLSGGQKQRVGIAGVLAMRPQIILFDEATAMLDPHGRAEVIKTAQMLNAQGITVVWITHFMEEAALARRVVVMDEGKIALCGTPREVFARVDALHALGLDVPPPAALGRALRAQGYALEEGLLTAEEVAQGICQLLSKT